MGKTNLKEVTKNIGQVIHKHSPEILMGFGITGMITTTVLAVKATPKAIRLIEEKKKELGVEKLTAGQTIKTTWKCYIPAVVTGAASAACLIGSSSVSGKRNAVLATAYKIAETTHKEYREKVIETLGEKKEKLIKDEIAKDKLEKDPVKNHEVIITDRGNTLCYDVLSGRYFKTDIDRIKKIENELNRRMVYDMYVSLNDFYREVGLDAIKLGDELGWNLDNGLIELNFSSQLAEYDQPCLVIDYGVKPKYNYEKLY